MIKWRDGRLLVPYAAYVAVLALLTDDADFEYLEFRLRRGLGRERPR